MPLKVVNDRVGRNELSYSRRNRTDILTSSEALNSLAEQIAIQFIEYRDGELKRRYSQVQEAECFQHFKLILVDLFAAYQADPRLYIGYSRGMNAYKRGGDYWDYMRDRPAISITYYLDAIDYLDELDLIEHHKADQGYGPISSRMRAAPDLAELYEETEANWASVKTCLDAPHIIVKDENKKPMAYPEPGDFDLERAVKHLRRINDNLQSTFINLDIPDETYDELRRRFTGVLDDDERDIVGEVREPFDFTNRTLRRIFAGGTFEKGGRFYGGWWQGVPSEYRKHIEIDGKITVEMDYSTMQPTIFYAQAGAERPIDSYTLDGWPQEKPFRKLVKKLFSQLVNSAPSSQNPNQWHRFAPRGIVEARPEEWELLPPHEKRIRERAAFRDRYGADYNDLIDSLLAFHKPIETVFFSKSWGRMQRIDSDIAESVMLKLLDHDEGITALPIHDSFIVRRGAEDTLRQAMSEAFHEIVGAKVGIDRDEAIFDPPESNDGRGLVFGPELHGSFRAHMETHSFYHRREHEWMAQYGSID